MATIRKRSTGSYEVQIRRQGFKTITKTFKSKTEAQKWARKTEADIEAGSYVNFDPARTTTLADTIDRYIELVLPKKKSTEPDFIRLQKLKEQLGQYSLLNLSPSVLSSYRDQRAATVTDSTVRRELSLLSRLLSFAQKDLGLHLPQGNPVRLIRIPKEHPHRTRRLEGTEKDLILQSLRSKQVKVFLEVLIETAMRRSELGLLQWADIDLDQGLAFLRDTKNGHSRMVPLSTRARTLLASLESARLKKGLLFTIKPEAVTLAFRRACERLGIENLHLHDLRREATSRLFEKGLSAPEVQTITGHRTLSMLAVYTRLKAEDLVQKVG
jgi:integrase